MLHPSYVSGPGWHVLTPADNPDPVVWASLATRPGATGSETLKLVSEQAGHLAPDHDNRARRVMDTVLADRAEQCLVKAAMSPAAYDQLIRVIGGV